MKDITEESTLTYLNEDGKEEKCTILFKIDTKEKNYLIYTDNTTDENGKLRTFASIYVPGDNPELKGIETEKEWKIIENFLSSMIEKKVKE